MSIVNGSANVETESLHLLHIIEDGAWSHTLDRTRGRRITIDVLRDWRTARRRTMSWTGGRAGRRSTTDESTNGSDLQGRTGRRMGVMLDA